MEREYRSLVSTDDLSDSDLRDIVERGVAHATGRAARSLPLEGDVVGVFFEMTSTRTRTAFSAGALRLGAQIVPFGPGDLQTNTGETFDDTGRVLARMLDVMVIRTGRTQDSLAAWAAQKNMATVNAMTQEEHPTQALTDLITMQARFGTVEGLRVCYVGEGNNTAAALALALTRFPGVVLELRTPPGYGLSAKVRARAEALATAAGSSFAERHDMDDLPQSLDVVYTTRWQTTGTTKPSADWRQDFAPFQVTSRLWEDSPQAMFMHDLPAHRGEEVTADVLDGPMSMALDQAENKMHSAMAVLEWCRGVCPKATR
ncbi:ornithine carbamoyltransferase [Streptomyces sp. SudanB182_2057]|uniref:ornithine carbamoyltransferase n=1 Tax=Streptomyces sp. SudanB182_2057 TaxID=3035281 RepID=UPI003F56BEA7